MKHGYTVTRLADIAGISSRTLRYYDQIRLLVPRREHAESHSKGVSCHERIRRKDSRIAERLHHFRRIWGWRKYTWRMSGFNPIMTKNSQDAPSFCGTPSVPT